MRRIARKLESTIRRFYAPFLVIDSHGTRISTWTRADALDWLNYTAPGAAIVNVYTGRYL